MARSINNPIMQGATGKVGKITFRRTIFGTVMANMPDYERTKVPTADQLAFRQRFKLGTQYIKARMEDPLFKERYAAIAKPGRSAYTTAFADFMSPPKIHLLDISLYQGQIGDTIRVNATDNFGIETVQVQIKDLAGVIIETGIATFDLLSADFTYLAASENASLVGSKIEVTVTDFSGAKTIQEATII
ncbi:hypothetical protein [Pedobacter insulae]|uniref:Uncharacterized protein n=1 Tax=Pedobacter insulae TaxID=414048 RepID=A0A1I3AEV2_9SPHI|nr:hypothetical protein [Pedobacter insulae]SFH48583.1 hypothetical protein SAMN04489864_11455 [Pedobacter insulae]